jgi:hypothetical protein
MAAVPRGHSMDSTSQNSNTKKKSATVFGEMGVPYNPEDKVHMT